MRERSKGGHEAIVRVGEVKERMPTHTMRFTLGDRHDARDYIRMFERLNEVQGGTYIYIYREREREREI